MCGIVGIVGISGQLKKIQSMADSLEHRGPDGQGVWQSSIHPVALGHRRLAIIDTSNTGAQPMVFSGAGLAIVYNGEIYNTTELRQQLINLGVIFTGHSDTEILLRSYEKWGVDCLDKISGMFAFAILDENKGTMLLARDRSGQKPLYYAKINETFAFSSEIKALRIWDKDLTRIDENSLQDYLTYGYSLDSRTLTENVKKVKPGELIILDIASNELNLVIKKYWQIPTPAIAVNSFNPAQVLQEFESLLEDSVKRHLMADVPIGIMLSGGIDSSLITAMAARNVSKVKTFSVKFPGHHNFDESVYAKQVAKHFNTEHIELKIGDFGFEVLQKLACQFDEPIADHAIVPSYLLSKRVKEEVCVALGGDGGDELFGGYPHYSIIEKQTQVRHIPSKLRDMVSYLACHQLPIGMKGRSHLMGMSGDIENSIAHVNLYFDKLWRERLLNSISSNLIYSQTPEEYKINQLSSISISALEKALYSDFTSTLPEGYMTKVDRSSMLASLEIRAPLLDDAIINFAFRHVPMELKYKNGKNKILLRQLATKLLPSEVANKPKQGFTMPLAQWLKAGWGGFFREILLDSSQTTFNHRAIEKLFTLQDKGLNNTNRIFSLAMFELWRINNGMSRQ